MVSEALAAFGLEAQEEISTDDDFYLWPENVSIFNFWLAVQTQWRTDSGQRVGLDYAGVKACMDMLTMRKSEKKEFFLMMQAMEQTSLNEWVKAR